ncbi:hypothetical protein BG015_003726 [Linnemannia schmuckeri]|uniref:Nonsense-mediated mRNA decay factor SMG8 n=1 Tax=Linnemannia schmuckeri TaxID=64567 RepID=A0A9P5V335_9FUNG|nr:hypothetical protein BG015_003726 [Linnemannia schmuckeri]
MQPPPHQESTPRQQQQQRDHSNTSTSATAKIPASASPARHGQADSHGDTELSSTGTNFRVASLASSEHQSTNLQPFHTRSTPLAQNNLRTTTSSNGNSANKVSADRATAGSANTAAAAMGDGIINQSMKEDLDNWTMALGLTPGLPVHVVGFFGHCRDLSMFERVTPAVRRKDGTYVTSSCIGSFEDDERMPVYYDGCRDSSENRLKSEQGAEVRNGGWTLGLGDQKTTGDIHLFVDRAKNTLMLQHAYLYDTQEMLSVCQESADAATKDRTTLMKWMHDQEYESHRALLFLFLVSHVVVHTSPDMNLDSRMISILAALSTIKRQMLQELDRFMAICWDRIGVPPPDHERNQSDNGGGGRGSNPLANILTPGRCVPVLIFVIERVPIIAPWHEAGASENQIVEVELPEALLDYSHDNGNETLDPATAVMRQRMRSTAGGSQPSKKQGSSAKLESNKSHREKTGTRSSADESNRTLGNPTLREIYDAVVQARDQPLSGTTDIGGRSATDGTSRLSLGGLYLDYSGPLLRQFVDGWLKNVTNPGGYGNIIGRRHIGAVEDDFDTDESISSKLQSVSIGGGTNGNSNGGGGGGVGGEAVREKGPRRGGKKYSLRCAHLVQKKIQDFVQTDEVMEEL